MLVPSGSDRSRLTQLLLCFYHSLLSTENASQYHHYRCSCKERVQMNIKRLQWVLIAMCVPFWIMMENESSNIVDMVISKYRFCLSSHHCLLRPVSLHILYTARIWGNQAEWLGPPQCTTLENPTNCCFSACSDAHPPRLLPCYTWKRHLDLYWTKGKEYHQILV